MSTTYQFSFHANIRVDLPTNAVAALDELLGETVKPSSTLPEHQFFSDGLPSRRFRKSHSGFPPEAYACSVWVERDNVGNICRRGVNLQFPSEKLEGVYEDCLPFASWLANISACDGFVGSFHQAETVDLNPTLLFIFRQQLYLGDSSEAYSFTTGDVVSFRPDPLKPHH